MAAKSRVPLPANPTTRTLQRKTLIMAECDPELETLHADLAAKRQAAASDHTELLGDIAHRRALAAISNAMPPLTDAQIAARETEQRDREAEREQYARHGYPTSPPKQSRSVKQSSNSRPTARK